ncbi:MAG: hypothetical protein K2J57_04225, partial [Bacteroidales bacterium]|nr:hypothetical protein [Bacteroidales bacterium]
METEVKPEEVKRFFEKGGFMFRNIFDFDTKQPTDFWFVIKDSFGGLEELGDRTRRSIKKSLKNYDFRFADKQEVAKQGYPIYLKAQQNYRVKAV